MAFNLSQAIENALKDDPEGNNKDILSAVKKKHPKEDINEKTASATISAKRSKLGLSKRSRAAGTTNTGGKKTTDILAFLSSHFGGDVEAAIAELTRFKDAGLTPEKLKAISKKARLEEELTEARKAEAELLESLKE